MPIDKHQKLYGYNFEKITYPFKNDPQFQLKWLDRLRGNYNFPAELIAEYNEDFKCKHGISFNSSDENLYRESVNFVLYSELIETVFYIPVFGRRSLGPCLCLQRVDGTKYLMWNLGQGRFVNFTLLHTYLHKWIDSGLKIFAMWKSITNGALSAGLSCSLQYNDLHRSICGFMSNLDLDFKAAFSCPTHGNSPVWIVSDGKNMGPLKKRVDHLKELVPEASDDNVLVQITTHKNRVFLSSKKERSIVCQVLTGDVTMQDFAEISDMTSSNGLLIIEIARHILETFPEGMPACYRHFLANVCKPTSVRGLLQVLSSEPLLYLEQFCKEELNLHAHSSQRQLKCVAASLPAVWPDLNRICNLTNSEFLPKEVSTVVLKLLSIRYSYNCT